MSEPKRRRGGGLILALGLLIIPAAGGMPAWEWWHARQARTKALSLTVEYTHQTAALERLLEHPDPQRTEVNAALAAGNALILRYVEATESLDTDTAQQLHAAADRYAENYESMQKRVDALWPDAPAKPPK